MRYDYLYNKLRYVLRMKERHWLSPQEYNFLSSQNVLLPNKSETLNRIGEKIQKSLETLDIVLDSREISFDFIMKNISIDEFVGLSTILLLPYSNYEPSQDRNYKLEIARRLISSGFMFYQQQFQESEYFEPKIKEIKGLLELLNKIANEYNESDPKFLEFKKKMKQRTPPVDPNYSHPDWTVECSCCWNWSSGKSKEDAVERLHHENFCTYDKKESDRFLRTFKPKK